MRKSKKIKHKPTLAVVVDGETEMWYLQMLKRNEKNIRVNIKPEIPHKKTITEQYKLVCSLSKQEFSKVFWIVDLDTIVKESREKIKEERSPFKNFVEYRNKIYKKLKNVIVIVNNPCLEFWFLLHFENTSQYFDTCSKVEKQLKKHLVDYKKNQKFFTKQDNDIYLKLKKHLGNAIQNATSLGTFDSTKETKALSEMQLFFLTKELKEYFNKNRIEKNLQP